MNITKEQEQAIVNILLPADPKRVGIFGSVARSEAGEESDIDILFSPQAAIGFFQLAAMKAELEDLLNRPVDLLTEGGLSEFIAEEVYNDLKIIYEA